MKMQWNQWLIIAAALTVGAGMITSIARAQDDGTEQDAWISRRTGGFVVRRIERQLQVTGAQKQQIKVILKTERPTISSLAMRVEKENQELQSQPTFDEAQVRQFAQQHEATLEDVLVEREKVRSEIAAVLTPEQRQRAQQLHGEMRARFNNRLEMLGDAL